MNPHPHPSAGWEPEGGEDLLRAAPTPEVLRELELIAAALEAAAEKAVPRRSVLNPYRLRLNRCLAFLARDRHGRRRPQDRAGREDGAPRDRSDLPAPRSSYGPPRPGGGP